MSSTKSQRRRIKCAAEPQVTSSDQNGVTVFVHEAGDHSKGVTFVMAWWQFKNFAKSVLSSSRVEARSLRDNATHIEAHMTEIK